MIVQDAQGLTPDIEDAGIWTDGLGLSYPVLADVEGTFYPEWDPEGVLPVAYIIDKDGRVAWAHAGGTDYMSEMEALVLDLLAQ